MVMTAEARLKELGLVLPQAPTPLGAYVEAVQTGNLLFLSGTLPVEQGKARYVGRIGADLTLEDGAAAARLAALNSLALARAHLGSLDEITRVVRLSVALVTTPEFRDHPKVADAASELLLDLFGREMMSTRAVLGVASLPLAACVETEMVFEIRPTSGCGHSPRSAG
jgi:enamine deaminase RidA (YjgF/YER057c/UK114 family)